MALALVLVAVSSVAMRGQEPPLEAVPLEGASLPDGGEPLGDGAFHLVAVRLLVAHEAQPATPHATALGRDHFVLELDLRQERATEAGRRALLEWNGAPSGELHLAPSDAGDIVTLRFDVGASLPKSNGYALQLAST